MFADIIHRQKQEILNEPYNTSEMFRVILDEMPQTAQSRLRAPESIG